MPIRAFAALLASLALVATAGAASGNGELAYYKSGSLYISAEDGSGETKVADAAGGGCQARAPR